MFAKSINSDRLPPPVRRMLLGITLSALGNGLVLPFAFVYLHSIRHISTPIAGLVFSYGAVIALLVAPVVGTLIDKYRTHPRSPSRTNLWFAICPIEFGAGIRWDVFIPHRLTG